ncbi:beta-amylase 3 [Actinidia rufa]|uniref:Beta-amylase n=1 Tax=Actinidia rufa TaxID=165716 RepID=A0A7J0HFM2_9ERIC|nr:beta-amylase 3 [Actinidia rufa]
MLAISSSMPKHSETLPGDSPDPTMPRLPSYDQAPNSNNFVKEHGESWETPYGDFFLSWYSNQLISHGDRLLSLASSTFNDVPVKVSGKVPLVHSWYKTRSHPSELTAGFYNTVSRDGDGVVEILQGIRGVNVWGQNSTISGAPNGFEQIKKNLLDENKVVDLFTYQRMGAYFFSPDHFLKCTEFVRRLTQPELHLDDLLSDEAESVCSEQGKNLHMQVA